MIRRRTARDLPDCVRLLHEVHLHSGYPLVWPEDPAGWLTPDGLTAAWVAEDGAGGVAGHAALCGRLVSRLYVAPSARGRGLGGALLRRLEQAAAARGLRAALSVHATGTDAIALYERHGWRPVATREEEWGAAGRVTVRCYEAPSAPARFKDLALDARDHQALADWWCAALGYVRRESADGGDPPAHRPVPIVDPTAGGPLIRLNPVTEAKTRKNRMHLDVYGDVERLLLMGAKLIRRRDADIAWDVLADPEGNEFCVFPTD